MRSRFYNLSNKLLLLPQWMIDYVPRIVRKTICKEHCTKNHLYGKESHSTIAKLRI